MDLKLLLSTFSLVFLAELGDKTQLATLSLAASGRSRLVVFAGASIALIATSGLAVLFGEAVTRVIPAAWIHRAAGVAFVVMGILLLLGKTSLEPAPVVSGAPRGRHHARGSHELHERANPHHPASVTQFESVDVVVVDPPSRSSTRYSCHRRRDGPLPGRTSR
jgi:hypothetical protein